MIFTQIADAHRTWKKYTKIPNGTYQIEYEYYYYKPQYEEVVTAKITNRYFIFDGSIENKEKTSVYPAEPLKLKLSKNCKFYNYDEDHCYRISKKKARSILKRLNWSAYITFHSFHVKGNKVDKVYLCYY